MSAEWRTVWQETSSGSCDGMREGTVLWKVKSAPWDKLL